MHSVVVCGEGRAHRLEGTEAAAHHEEDHRRGRRLRALRAHLDPNNHNGAVFLGLNGIVVKSHGGANAAGMAAAIGLAIELLADDITRRIEADLNALGAAGAQPDVSVAG